MEKICVSFTFGNFLILQQPILQEKLVLSLDSKIKIEFKFNRFILIPHKEQDDCEEGICILLGGCLRIDRMEFTSSAYGIYLPCLHSYILWQCSELYLLLLFILEYKMLDSHFWEYDRHSDNSQSEQCMLDSHFWEHDRHRTTSHSEKCKIRV